MYESSESAKLKKGKDDGNIDKEGPGGGVAILVDENVKFVWAVCHN